MNFQNNRYTLKFADSSDNEGIRKIFEDSTFDGGLSVQYLRGSLPYESFMADGDSAKILVIIDNNVNRTIAVGGAVERVEYLNGKAEKCAYLTGLKIHPDYHNRISFIAKAYRFLYEEISDCKFFYSTILDDNKGAIALLEKKHRNMPSYKYLGHYTTYCFHGGKSFFSLERNNLEGFDKLLKSHFSRLSLTPVNYNSDGFGEKTFYSLRENGEIIACCFAGNQQANKQYKMSSYNGIYRFISKLPTQLFGYPKFPKSNSIINHGVISYLYIKNNDKELCKRFLRSVAKVSGFSLLIWGGFENNPLCEALDSMKTIHYGSRLYSIIWDDSPDITGEIGVEVGVL